MHMIRLHLGRHLDIVDDELLEASQEFYKKNTALYGIDELL